MRSLPNYSRAFMEKKKKAKESCYGSSSDNCDWQVSSAWQKKSKVFLNLLAKETKEESNIKSTFKDIYKKNKFVTNSSINARTMTKKVLLLLKKIITFTNFYTCCKILRKND